MKKMAVILGIVEQRIRAKEDKMKDITVYR